MLLAGDIGGTKTQLGVFSPDTGPRAPLRKATLPSAEYESLEALCQDFLGQGEQQVTHASFGVPGPVMKERVAPTNLPWEIDRGRLRESLGLESAILFNDIVAVIYGLPALEPNELHAITPGEADPRGPIAVIAPGTGLGEAYATYGLDGYEAHASEGGHADFAPTTELQDGLLAFVRNRYQHVSYERVLSGIGLPNLYEYLKSIDVAEEPAWLAAELVAAEDQTPVIVNAAQDTGRPCLLAKKTLELFVSILGAKAGNLALTTLATGGVYIGGGIPPRILPALSDGTFTSAFQRKGRLRPVLEKIPVRVICNPDAPFLGAACHGLRRLAGSTQPSARAEAAQD